MMNSEDEFWANTVNAWENRCCSLFKQEYQSGNKQNARKKKTKEKRKEPQSDATHALNEIWKLALIRSAKQKISCFSYWSQWSNDRTLPGGHFNSMKQHLLHNRIGVDSNSLPYLHLIAFAFVYLIFPLSVRRMEFHFLLTKQ